MLAAASVVGVAGLRTPHLTLRFVCILIAASGLGFTAAKWRTERVAAPVLHKDMGPLWIEGRIETVTSPGDKGAQIVIAPSRIGKDTDELPRRLRLSVRGEKALASVAPGATVRLLAMVHPPPEPVAPHGYDFARWAYFQGIGGVGFMMGSAQPLTKAEPVSILSRVNESIERLRLSMDARIQNAVPGADGAIASSLVTGERGGITEEDNNAYRASGLVHVLSISGLHMALAGLGIFWVVRALLALWPALALNQPIKKWAALAAIGGATFYLLISGGGTPPVRSYIMLVIMLAGVLFDRPALSMRNVALAALAILVVMPESIIDPGFEMSFAAVIGLIALAEWPARRPRQEQGGASWPLRLWQHAYRYALGVAITSIVATLATSPFAVYHFDRTAGYALISNMLALPIVGAAIMPAAALGVVLMPVGLEAWPFRVMGAGVHAMSAIAHWVTNLPGASMLAPAWPLSAVLLIVAGGLWIALWQRRWRWAGLVPVVAGLVVAFTTTAPDILFARDGQMAAVRQKDGTFAILALKPDDYTSEQWLLRDGDSRSLEEAQKRARCDDLGCTAQMADGRVVALSLRADALYEDCAHAGVVLSAVPVRMACKQPSVRLDLFNVLDGGATALWLTANGARIKTVRDVRGKRPWAER